jgi:tripartite-type tricarboxylate transporter receptor subunit TctC
MRPLSRLLAVLAALPGLVLSPALHAQSGAFPEKPVRIVVPFAPGGLVDASMRQLAPKMGEALGQPLIIDNKGGAGGVIGMTEVAHSAPDGYTLLFTIESLVLSPLIYRKPGFDPIRDFQPISEVLSVPIAILVPAALPVHSLKELAAYSHAHPASLSAGSGGTGTATHLCLEAIKAQTGADFVHIPYKGAGPAFSDFLAGQTQLFAVSTAFSLPHVRSGKVRAIAVASDHRAANMPDVPTTAEAGYPGIEFSTWMGLIAPAGTPSAVVERIREAALRSLRDPDNRRRFAEQGTETVGSDPAEFARYIATESAKFARAVALAGIKPD